ncbi:hypothetical protein ACFSFY_15640 [Sporosarcina siberiensis]|uniref:ABC transporter permease n=1 Tax=Sporosarcina siberiensis TaxID=1365606 RepID=A0ABW4SM05_9BACL
MYLTEPRLADIVKKQIQYKFNGYTGVFTSLLVMQLLGIFTSFGNGGHFSSYGETLEIAQMQLTNDTLVIFTLVWAVIQGILLTTMAYRNDAFTFVSNRFSHHISSYLFLMIAAIIGGLTAALAGSTIKLFAIMKYDSVAIETAGFFSSPYDFALRVIASIFYTLLFASIGYAIGSLIQRSKLVIPIIFIAVFVGPWFLLGVSGFNINQIALFYGNETSIVLFILKVLVTVVLLFVISVAITNKTEVRK